MANITGPYTAALYEYVRGELKFESDLPYEILNPKVGPGVIVTTRTSMSTSLKRFGRPSAPTRILKYSLPMAFST